MGKDYAPGLGATSSGVQFDAVAVEVDTSCVEV